MVLTKRCLFHNCSLWSSAFLLFIAEVFEIHHTKSQTLIFFCHFIVFHFSHHHRIQVSFCNNLFFLKCWARVDLPTLVQHQWTWWSIYLLIFLKMQQKTRNDGCDSRIMMMIMKHKFMFEPGTCFMVRIHYILCFV